MLPVVVFALIAGVLTILAPCTLPVVPLVMGAASTGGKGRTTGLLLGFGLTFVGVTVVLASVLAAAGLTTTTLRIGSAIVLGAVGLSLAVPMLATRFEWALAPVSRLGSRLVGGRPGTGILGGMALGAAIGLIWAPCVGPIMAAVIAVAATHGPTAETALIALAYVTGAAIPIGLIAGWGRRASGSLRGIAGPGRLQRGFGIAMILSAALVVSGLDLTVENSVASILPAGWTGALTFVEQQPTIQEELTMLEATRANSGAAASPDASAGPSAGPLVSGLPPAIGTSLPANIALENLGRAPEMTGITAWINSKPLTVASLRGKVVLVEFWTFACINCIHVQPYVKAWYDRYASAGLVVIGVHTPELSFERDLTNVRDAVAKAGLRYPVAFDPNFGTWNAYRNNYWPAFFFIDKTGQIRHSHFGEGDYDGSEQVIRQLLAQPG